MAFLKLIRNAEVYAPESLGIKDVLISSGRIIAVEDKVEIKTSVDLDIIDAAGMCMVPGFIDSHVHITGGGGEGSFKSRTPGISLSDITAAGVTTVVGCLGTDGITRNMSDLVAKARALEEEGITCYVYTGSYQIPVRTLTSSILEDLVFIDKIIGVGETAISDHRSSQPGKDDICKIAAEARVGGMLSGKAGIVNIHVGPGKNKLKLLEEVINDSEIPITQFLPTHLARSYDLFMAAIPYAKQGGLIDLTTSSSSHYASGKIGTAADALKELLSRNVPLSNISFSSDGQGSLPSYDAAGNLTGLSVGSIKTLFDEFRKAVVEHSLPIETVLRIVTENPARNLQLDNKGAIQAGKDADLLLLDKNYQIHSVFAMGRQMIEGEKVIIRGVYENSK